MVLIALAGSSIVVVAAVAETGVARARCSSSILARGESTVERVLIVAVEDEDGDVKEGTGGVL